MISLSLLWFLRLGRGSLPFCRVSDFLPCSICSLQLAAASTQNRLDAYFKSVETPLLGYVSKKQAVVHLVKSQVWLREARESSSRAGRSVVWSPGPWCPHVEVASGKILKLKLLPVTVQCVCVCVCVLSCVVERYINTVHLPSSRTTVPNLFLHHGLVSCKLFYRPARGAGLHGSKIQSYSE